jgi:hypothetical protein
MRKTSKDYKSELNRLRTRQKALEARIKSRLVEMVERNPDAIVLEKGLDKFKAKCVTKQWIENLSLDTMIEYIRSIEEHNAEPYIQTKLYD